VPPSQLCGASCDADEHCPAGYRCDFINIAGQGFNLCQPAVEISPCPDGTNRACGGVCPLEGGERDEDVAHCIVVDERAPGYCACSCRDASDCPQGFGCGRQVFDSGDPQRPGICLPIAGFICPEGPNGGAACLSLACYDAPGDDRPPQCTTICDRRADCPEDYACRAVPGEGINVCLPQ